MTTYVLRHAPTTYSERFLVNGDPGVDVSLTPGGPTACEAARREVPIDEIATCVSSRFLRCRRTAELIIHRRVNVHIEPRLNELDYGVFEGRPFMDYALWLAEHGPRQLPPKARESQAQGILRMVSGLGRVLAMPAPRLVVAHGLLLSTIAWAQAQPDQELTDVFLPPAAPLAPVVLDDEELQQLAARLRAGLTREPTVHEWRADPQAFPVTLRDRLANVSPRVRYESAPVHQHEEAVSDA